MSGPIAPDDGESGLVEEAPHCSQLLARVLARKVGEGRRREKTKLLNQPQEKHAPTAPFGNLAFNS